jgi:zinc/manganese transport system permease protein
VTLACIFRPLVLDTVDPGFLRSISSSGTPVHLIFLVLVVLNLVGGFNALGTLLSVGLMMLPAASSRFWTNDISSMMGIAMLAGVISCLSGLLLSFHFNFAAGPSIILMAGVIYLLSIVIGYQEGFIWKFFRGRHLAG